MPERNLERSDIFITSKIPPQNMRSMADCRNTIGRILEELDTEYIDLFLIHHPPPTRELRELGWRCLLEFYKKGTFKTIGWRNF